MTGSAWSTAAKRTGSGSRTGSPPLTSSTRPGGALQRACSRLRAAGGRLAKRVMDSAAKPALAGALEQEGGGAAAAGRLDDFAEARARQGEARPGVRGALTASYLALTGVNRARAASGMHGSLTAQFARARNRGWRSSPSGLPGLSIVLPCLDERRTVDGPMVRTRARHAERVADEQH